MLFIFVSILLGPILLAVGWLVAPRSPSEQKLSPYECGFSPLEGQTRSPLSVAFYLVGILFLLFDLELLVTFPFIASNGPFSSPLSFWTLFWFIALLTGGFVFEIRLGVLLSRSKKENFQLIGSIFVMKKVILVLMLAFLDLSSQN